MMLTSTILSAILALQLFTSPIINVRALPITSKPIEGTAEHLAWQAWLMLPPEQKNLEKSRKVTPKSIFMLPNRNCPAGHQLFENRCIPTVTIDPTELLTQQLLGLVAGDSNGDINYEFDYDDDIGTDEIIDITYDPAEKLSMGDNSKDTYFGDQLPSLDEPLKFNIFQKKFPTDYEAESMPSDEPQEMTDKSTTPPFNATESLAQAVNALNATTEPNLNATQGKNNTNVVDLQMESSNISMNIAENINSNSNMHAGGVGFGDGDTVASSTAFSISDIDAIVLPAVPTHNSNLESNERNVHKFSLFKDDSTVQLVTSTLLAERQQQQQPDLSQLLKADDLLPLPNITAQTVSQTPERSDNVDSAKTPGSTALTTARTASVSGDNEGVFGDNEVPTTSTTLFASTFDTTLTPLSGSSSADEAVEVTDMMLSDSEATLSPSLDDLLKEDDEKVATPGESRYGHAKKEERPRSVIMRNATSAMTEPQEEKFTTTTEPDVTTNFQVDETTVDEVHDAPTIALRELLELAQHPSAKTYETLGAVVKKSKVEPVELPPIVFTDSETDSSVMTTSTAASSAASSTASTSTPKANLVATKVGGEVLQSSTLLPAVSSQSDRFDDQRLGIGSDQRSSSAKPNDEQLNDSNLRNNNIETTKPTKPTTKTSEIDIKQELRMINELVKGNSNSNRKQQIKGGIIKSETGSMAESGLTTGKNDKVSGSATQPLSTLNEEESRTTIAVTPTTTSTASTQTEPTATLWSKIMPLFGFGAACGESSTSTSTSPSPSTTPTPTTPEITPQTIPSEIVPPKTSAKTVSSSNRSNRNSKIIRINSLSTPSLSSFSFSSNTDKGNSNNFIADKLASSTIAPLPTTTEFNFFDTTTGSNSPSERESESEPFWWLPIGWRLDRSSDGDSVGHSVDEPSLLLRFWSAFPESEGSTKQRK